MQQSEAVVRNELNEKHEQMGYEMRPLRPTVSLIPTELVIFIVSCFRSEHSKIIIWLHGDLIVAYISTYI